MSRPYGCAPPAAVITSRPPVAPLHCGRHVRNVQPPAVRHVVAEAHIDQLLGVVGRAHGRGDVTGGREGVAGEAGGVQCPRRVGNRSAASTMAPAPSASSSTNSEPPYAAEQTTVMSRARSAAMATATFATAVRFSSAADEQRRRPGGQRREDARAVGRREDRGLTGEVEARELRGRVAVVEALRWQAVLFAAEQVARQTFCERPGLLDVARGDHAFRRRALAA